MTKLKFFAKYMRNVLANFNKLYNYATTTKNLAEGPYRTFEKPCVKCKHIQEVELSCDLDECSYLDYKCKTCGHINTAYIITQQILL